jgi:hypothetical protein
MRGYLVAFVGTAVLLLGTAGAIGQPPGKGKAGGKPPKAPPDEAQGILNQIKEAYKAPYEVHQDVLKELRKLYQQPTPEREAKIFRELRRLYAPTPEQEDAILREIRRAYQFQSPEQEARVLQEIQKAERLPLGAVPQSVQVEQSKKLFLKLDLNGDGVLSTDEMADSLRAERARWDADRNGFIDLNEYGAYYQVHLHSLSEAVATGQIDLGLKRGGPGTNPTPTLSIAPAPNMVQPRNTSPANSEETGRPAVYRAGNLPAGLPAWFVQLDTDRDGQIALYEWRKGGRPLKEFHALDPNDDGFLTVEELLRLQPQQARGR